MKDSEKSSRKNYTTTWMFVGLFCGILYAFGGFIIDLLVSIKVLSSETMGTPGLSYGTFLAFGAVIVMPIIFAMIGFIFGRLDSGWKRLCGRDR